MLINNIPSGTQLPKFARYPVPSGTQIFKISMGTGRYPGTHGYRGTARADPCPRTESFGIDVQ